MTAPITCPGCAGRGGGYGFINPPPPATGGAGWIPCDVCRGARCVSERVATQHAEGSLVREARRGIGLRDGARRLGLTVVQLGEVECGLRAAPEGWRALLAGGAP